MDKQINNIDFTILGCGSSGGVPRSDGSWGDCNPNNPKNYRTRSSLFVQINHEFNMIIDTSPDFRIQALREGISHIDAVLFTHDHADQTHGIDDVRAFYFRQKSPMQAYGHKSTMDILKHRFDYIFHEKPNSGYPPLLTANIWDDIGAFSCGGYRTEMFEAPHGHIMAYGFIIADMAYSPDVHFLSYETLTMLKEKKLKYWIVDCLRYTPHVSHANLETVLKWHEVVRPELTILTNLHIDLDYDELSSRLPKNIIPAYDGLKIRI